jgi:UDP-2,4-diacetamido-2,4,6-trideoxy-beta-L-altropyranose hydrolase
MRCLALANALRDRGAHVQFVSRQLPAHLHALAVGGGHEVTSLPVSPLPRSCDDLPHARWLGTSQHADADLTHGAIASGRVGWLIVDHYALDARWESALRSRADRILAVDDLADRAHDCDALLDQNLFEDMPARYAAQVPAQCELLLGPKYALLRKEFRDARATVRMRDGRVRRILILMGGVDFENLTGRAIEAVCQLADPVDVDVVIGAEHPAREALAASCRNRGYALHVQSANVARLMQTADLAVGAGGSTNWERCCLGLPGVVISVADNQDGIARALHKAGAIVYLGRSDSVSVHAIVAQLRELLADPARVASTGAQARDLVDGDGATRVADFLWHRI